MSLFSTIFIKLIPLYLMIALGYVAARVLKTQRESIARLLMYIIAPVVIFYGTYTAKIDVANLSLPILFFIVCAIMAMIFLSIGNLTYGEDSTKNILSFTSGSSNTGYFGLPVVIALFGDQAISLAVLIGLGYILYENSVGFFILARGSHTLKESLKKIIKLPAIYAFFIGLIVNALHINLGEMAITTIGYFKGAYTLLGMMMIGLGLAAVKIRHIDIKFISLAFCAKFIVWPIAMLGIIFIDKTYIHLYSQNIYNIMIIMSVVPLAVNTVVLATELKVHPEKAALAVLLSTLFALFYIPLMVHWFIVL